MKRVERCRKQLLFIALVISVIFIPSTIAHADASSDPKTTRTKIGNPAWVPVDLKVFTARIGSSNDNYAAFYHTQSVILPPPHYKPYPGLGIGPGTPKAPPYNHDVSDGVDDARYVQDSPFLPGQFSHRSGVYLVYMVVPPGGTHNIGSSPDFQAGPIIPNSFFPIHVSGVTYRNGSVYDSNLTTFKVPPLNDPSVIPPFNVDGHSHFPIIIAESADLNGPGAKVSGRFTFKVTMTDRLGNGWTISASFQVEDE